MRIITAFDTHSYSAKIVSEVAKLAANTWADITMLAVQTNSSNALDPELAATLKTYKEEFIKYFQGEELPYNAGQGKEEFQNQNGSWVLASGDAAEGSRKKLQIKVRGGDPTKEILAEAEESEADLIIFGCSKGLDCQWQGENDLPRKIAKKADCSVLVIKERKDPSTITCCLDQTQVSQASLEMINQIVTLYGAELKVIGLTATKGTEGKEGVESKMAEILKYYGDRQINAWIKLVHPDDLEEYVAQASHEDMIGLWMGKQSLLGKIFSRDLVGKLVSSSQSSVLILR